MDQQLRDTDAWRKRGELEEWKREKELRSLQFGQSATEQGVTLSTPLLRAKPP